MASKTGAFIAVLNGITALRNSRKSQNYIDVHHKYKLFKVLHYARKFGNAAKEGLKRPSHWAAYYFKSKFLVSCTRTCHYPVGHTSNLTFTSRTDGTTEHTEDEGLDINICCSSNKSFNSPVVPLFRRANRLASSVLTLRSS